MVLEGGSSTHYDYGFRVYNPGIARFLSVDPLAPEYPFYSPYHFAGNMPISARDVDGREPDVENGRLVGYTVQADQGPTQIAADINDPSTMKKYGYCLLEPVDWQQVVQQNVSKFPNQAEGGSHPGFVSDRSDINDPEYRRLNVNPKDYLTIRGDCDDCGGDPSGNSPVPPRNPSPTIPDGGGPGIIKRLWDSDVVRVITGDAISISLEFNGYSFMGGSTHPVGGMLLLHGPEAFTRHGFSDAGLGVGVEWSMGVSVDKHYWLTNPENIKSADFGGLRTSGSIDIGEGVVGGVNFGINNPAEDSPFIISGGGSIGVGATSPFGVGGNVNEGGTVLWSRLKEQLDK